MKRMKVIVGLGNPGAEYVRTRHNVGFRAVEALAVSMSLTFSFQKKLRAQVAQKGDLYLIKPETFMNASGESVRSLYEYFGNGKPTSEELKELYVIHDDLDILIGKYKITVGHGPKVHNGLLSMYQHLDSQLFHHVRVGIENRGTERGLISGSHYVLAAFTRAEEDILRGVYPPLIYELKKQLVLG